MAIDVYHKYNFEYNEKTFMENLKKVLNEKGYKTCKDFLELTGKLCNYGTEYLRSIYYLRRVIPFKLLVKLCQTIDLNVTEIMFPNSIQITPFKLHFGNYSQDCVNTFYVFNEIFYIYNDEAHPEVVDNEEQRELRINNPDIYYKGLKNCVDVLELILSRYNYLLQKYYFADLPGNELNDLGIFSCEHLINRVTKEKLDFKEFRMWKEQLKLDDFLKDFYNKYTFAHHDEECKVKLAQMKNHIPDDLFMRINNLLPEQDRIIQ